MNAELLQLIPCTKCGREVSPGTYDWNGSLCDPCYTWKRYEEDNKDRTKTSMERRIESWNVLCPELYRTTPTDFIDKDKLLRVTRWKYGARGILCTGASRRGKTTSCWHLLNRLYTLEGKTFVAVTEPEFSIIREKSTRNQTLDAWLNKCIHADVFFLDDIGHSATSSKHMEELYFVIEKRVSMRKPIIATTQFGTDEFREKASRSGTGKTAVAILNRIMSFCDVVEF